MQPEDAIEGRAQGVIIERYVPAVGAGKLTVREERGAMVLVPRMFVIAKACSSGRSLTMVIVTFEPSVTRSTGPGTASNPSIFTFLPSTIRATTSLIVRLNGPPPPVWANVDPLERASPATALAPP
jgi:hypothetical protein